METGTPENRGYPVSAPKPSPSPVPASATIPFITTMPLNLSKDQIEIDVRSEHLTVKSWVFREVAKADEYDTGYRLEAILENVSKFDLEQVNCEMRHFDSQGEFVGIEEDESNIFLEIPGGGDKSITMRLDPPAASKKAVLIVTSSKAPLKSCGLIVIATILLLAALAFAIGMMLWYGDRTAPG